MLFRSLAMMPADLVTEGVVHEIKTVMPTARIKNVKPVVDNAPFHDDPIPF